MGDAEEVTPDEQPQPEAAPEPEPAVKDLTDEEIRILKSVGPWPPEE